MPGKKKDRSGTHFLNVDLDITASKGLDELVEALKPAFLLSQYGNRASLELNKWTKSTESTIKGFVKLVQKLPPRKSAIWNKAKRKTMNIGIEAGLEPYSTEFTLSSDVLSLLDSIGADVAFTVYAPEKEKS